MSAKTRREREREETRGKILDAARELFAQQGFDAVTMRSIAQKIDYTPTCIYFHFADKEALFREICVEDFQQFQAEMRPAIPIADPRARIRFLGQLYLDFAARHPNHYRLLFMADVPHDIEKKSELAEAGATDAYLTLVQACEEAIAQGRVKRVFNDPALLAQTFWAGVHGVASLHLVKPGNDIEMVDFARAGTAMLDAMMDGLMLAEVPAPVAA